MRTFANVQEIVDWLDNEPSKSFQFLLQATKGIVASCLWNLSEEYKEYLQHLKIINKPKKGVYARQTIGQGKLTLVPSSPNITTTIMDAGAKQPSKTKDNSHLDLGVLMVHPVTTQNVAFAISPLTTMPSSKQKGFICPFFFVRASPDREECNMEYKSLTMKHFGGTCDKKAGIKQSELKDLVVQTMTNVKKVGANEELVVFDASLLVEPAAKRARS
jgi:hypothetical protein